MAKPHVTILLPGYHLFGQERALINLAEILRGEGMHVSILLHHTFGKKNLSGYLKDRGFPVFFLPFNTIWSLSLLLKNPLDAIKNIYGIFSSSRVFSKLVERYKIDVLIAGNWSFGFYLLPALYRHRIGLIYRHGDAPPVSNITARFIAKSLFRRASIHVANCDFLEGKLKSYMEVDDVRVVRNYPLKVKKSGLVSTDD
ncbi:MAG: glycosyltransferase, partial [Pseudomonadota bacterium]